MNNPGTIFFICAGIPILLAGLIYARGAWQRQAVGRPVGALRHAAFLIGLALFFISLQWPFAKWSHELFSVHQVGILIARILTPALIALAQPAGLFIVGLPRSVRNKLLKPGVSASSVRLVWRLVAHPAVALCIYVGALYFWETPAMQEAAVTQAGLGLIMHLTLLLAGLLFWTRIFERRPTPHGPSHAVRLMMLLLAILTQIALGAFITIKTTIFYNAYVAAEQAALVNPIADESRGGFFIWVVSSFLSLIGIIAVADMWGRHETRMDAKRTRWSSSNSAILLYPRTGKALREMARIKNRGLAIGLAAFALLMFTAICGIVVGAHRLHRRENIELYAASQS